MRPSFFHHLHPPTIPAAQSRLRYTLGAGGLSVYLLLVLFLTGALEMFYYLPTPEGAAQSIQALTFLVPYGWLVRSLHYWAAQGLVVAALIHMLRVIFTGAATPHRRFNYLLGFCLLVLTLFLDFTGYVLRWDEGIHWALVAGTNLIRTIPGIGQALYLVIVGGAQPGPATLIRFYAWHIFGLSLFFVILGAWHLFRVRRDGGIAVPPPGLRADPSRITRFELVHREGLAAILASAVLLLLATLFPAPLAQPIQAGASLGADSRAPWFFLWVQQMLNFGDPFFWGVLVPFILLAVMALIPYLFRPVSPGEVGQWFPHEGRPAQITAAAVLLILLGLTIYALLPDLR